MSHDDTALARVLLVNFEKELALEIEDQELLERELRTLAPPDEA